MLPEQSLGDYLTALASSRGTPGGGAAAAVTGAQAAALMSMVCNLTRNGSDELAAARARAETARIRFISLAELDIVGFKAVMAAWKLRGETRSQALQAALFQACEAPLEMLREAAGLIDSLAVIDREGNANLITDTAIAACLLESTLTAARLNVLINTRAMESPAAAEPILAEVSELLGSIQKLSAMRQKIETSLMSPA
ncbi:MAG: cyclodeaminase/cyclohydrolase family protein [Pseudomonadota bacterium]